MVRPLGETEHSIRGARRSPVRRHRTALRGVPGAQRRTGDSEHDGHRQHSPAGRLGDGRPSRRRRRQFRACHYRSASDPARIPKQRTVATRDGRRTAGRLARRTRPRPDRRPAESADADRSCRGQRRVGHSAARHRVAGRFEGVSGFAEAQRSTNRQRNRWNAHRIDEPRRNATGSADGSARAAHVVEHAAAESRNSDAADAHADGHGHRNQPAQPGVAEAAPAPPPASKPPDVAAVPPPVETHAPINLWLAVGCAAALLGWAATAWRARRRSKGAPAPRQPTTKRASIERSAASATAGTRASSGLRSMRG